MGKVILQKFLKPTLTRETPIKIAGNSVLVIN